MFVENKKFCDNSREISHRDGKGHQILTISRFSTGYTDHYTSPSTNQLAKITTDKPDTKAFAELQKSSSLQRQTQVPAIWPSMSLLIRDCHSIKYADESESVCSPRDCSSSARVTLPDRRSSSITFSTALGPMKHWPRRSWSASPASTVGWGTQRRCCSNSGGIRDEILEINKGIGGV